ncbi:hypothetical protein K438DRAFT_2142244 [Mycena galopus ATCC 62051]|nr:hypothetical protein K438DRAFT_2142244 [Mycena galopus ATCC 62051]
MQQCTSSAGSEYSWAHKVQALVGLERSEWLGVEIPSAPGYPVGCEERAEGSFSGINAASEGNNSSNPGKMPICRNAPSVQCSIATRQRARYRAQQKLFESSMIQGRKMLTSKYAQFRQRSTLETLGLTRSLVERTVEMISEIIGVLVWKDLKTHGCCGSKLPPSQNPRPRKIGAKKKKREKGSQMLDVITLVGIEVAIERQLRFRFAAAELVYSDRFATGDSTT